MTPTKLRISVFLAAGLAGAVLAGEIQNAPSAASPLPSVGCWFWNAHDNEPVNHAKILDSLSSHASFDLLTTSPRLPRSFGEITDEAWRVQTAAAAAYARQRGIGIVMDLDVRLARAAFQKAHPDEMQEMLRLREVELKASGEVNFEVKSEMLDDHYTYGNTPYVPLYGRLLKVYAYRRGPDKIKPDSVREITASCVRSETREEVRVTIPCSTDMAGHHACVIVTFGHFTPDVFAPHLLEFQRKIYRQYAEAGLAGVCKDEWGFPPCFDGCPTKNDFWYSKATAEAYRARTGGRDLIRDCLLMCFSETGRERERQAAINHYMEMNWQRNAAVEDDFYRATKEIFGAQAVVGTHPTWWPFPDSREFKKNGLSWWAATRDLAQTDEVTPFSVRTALAKKWGSPVWYNMFYSGAMADYEIAVWAAALGGGRINFHPLYPYPHERGWNYGNLLTGSLMRAQCRIRLLDYVAKSPIDCPVAVVFGHLGAMNWAGPGYDDVGLALADALWRVGYYADLIPSSEIASGALSVSASGFVEYGKAKQPYAAVILYHPEFERPATAELFRRATLGRTALFRVGDWTRGFDGQPFDGKEALPAAMAPFPDADSCATAVIARLRELGRSSHTAAGETIGWDRRTAAPPRAGQHRLIDGTRVIVAGAEAVAGDLIKTALAIDGHSVEVDALGVVAVKLGKDGVPERLAAGGLRHFKAGQFEIRLEQRLDLALWRDVDGQWIGVIQGCEGAVPPSLMSLTTGWKRLALPTPLAAEDSARVR